MTAIVGWEIEPFGFVIGSIHDAANIEDRVLTDMFLIAAQDIWRRGCVSLHVFIKFEPVGFTEVFDLADPQNHAF